MANEQTLEINGLQLRRTEQGWQCLVEHLPGVPHTWCDATGVHGPFVGEGLHRLLDVLASTQAAAAAREEELTDVLLAIRGKSSCTDAWDMIEEVVACEGF